MLGLSWLSGQHRTRARVITVSDQGSLEFQYKAELWSGGPGSNAAVNQSWATLVRL